MLTHLIDNWSSLYANHAALRTAVGFLHIGGLTAGGGCAITADLATITAARTGSTALAVQRKLLQRTHAIVIGGLSALTVSGVLMFAADVDTFWGSRVFWGKMALMVLLLVNGVRLVRSEHEAGSEAQAWARLHTVATVSLVLWFLTALAGAALPNLG